MRSVYALFTLSMLLITGWSCKKDKKQDSQDCLPADRTIRVITDQAATVNISGGLALGEYLVESNSIDTKLVPCQPLPQEFQRNNLKVIISGEVKATLTSYGQPCCTYNFVVTKITLQ